MSDYDSDPLGNLDARVNQLTQFAQAQLAERQQQQAYHRAAAETQEMIGKYQEQAAAYSKDNPAFTDTYSKLTESRQQELMSVGYSEREAANLLVREEAMIVQKALADGVNPAQRMFELAKARGIVQDTPTLEAAAEEWNAMKAEQVTRPGQVDSLSDSELDRLWSEMERKELGPKLW